MVQEWHLYGPPGTGKTHAVAEAVARAAATYGSDRVLVCAYTRAAALELMDRKVPVAGQNIGTIHALIWRALGKPELAEAHLRRWNEHHPGLELSAGCGFEDGELVIEMGSSSLGDLLLGDLQRCRAMNVQPSHWPDSTTQFAVRWNDWKANEGLIDFTDLLERSEVDLPTLGRPLSVAYVDEAQDLSPLQVRIVRSWARGMEHLLFAGDPDQCIYGWNGASPRAFLEPGIDAQHVRRLVKSNRVPRAVHAVARRWIQRARSRLQTDYEPRDFEGRAYQSGSAISSAEDVADMLVQNAEAGKTAMLLAPCAFQLGPAIAALKNLCVPFWNPYRPNDHAWNPLRFGARRVLALLGAMPDDAGRSRTWTARELATWAEPVGRSYMLPGGKKRIGELDHESRKVTDDDLRAIFTESALSQLRSAISSGLTNRVADWYEHACAGRRGRENEYALTVLRLRGVAAMHEQPRIIVGTIHSVKGGQAQRVILCPDLSGAGMREWMGTEEQRDSVLRLFYVGATRASEELVLLRRRSDCSVDMENFL